MIAWGPPHHPAAVERSRALHAAMAGLRRQRALPFRILIADGGSPTRCGGTCRGEKVRKDWTSSTCAIRSTAATPRFYAKLADALSRVTTPFVVMADNDDLFIPEGLTRAVEFLSAHPDYVACGGQCAVFWIAGTRHCRSRHHLRRRRRVEVSAASSRPTWPTPRNERLRERCLGANDVFYAVHRTDLLRQPFRGGCATAIRVICS